MGTFSIHIAYSSNRTPIHASLQSRHILISSPLPNRFNVLVDTPCLR